MKGIGQELRLKITGTDSINNATIDSISYSKYFKDYKTIKTEVDSFQTKLFASGYLNYKLIDFKKENDSTFNATFQLNDKYSHIRISYDPNIIKQSIINDISSNTNIKDSKIKIKGVWTK